MWTAVVLWLYGSLLIIGTFLAVFWIRFASKRLGAIPHRWFEDRYFILALGLALWTSGQVILNAGRLVGNIVYGISDIMQRPEGYVIAGGLLLIVGGGLVLVWLADLERHPPRWRYLRAMAAATLAWAVASLVLATYVPVRHQLPHWLQPFV